MDTFDATQTDAIAFLKTHATCGSSVADDVVHTHGALVFLHKDEALKIKRAVKYDYLDFSTLGLRKKMLVRELELNRDAASGLYRDVIALTRAPDGSLTLGGEGGAVEWVLRMTRFPADAELSVLADRDQIDARLSDSLGRSIAQYHQRALRCTPDGRVLIAEIVDELDRVLAKMHRQLGAAAVQDYLSRCKSEQTRIGALMTARARLGWVRRCHGDLHLRNIVIWNGVPTPFDALEFDERLGTCDVLYDLAFLLMDLSHRGLYQSANLVLNSYLFRSGTNDHLSGLATLPLFLAIRAGIRAMVDVQTAAVRNDDENILTDARAFMRQALAFLEPDPPRLIAIGGLSGSGKTTVAHEIAHLIGAFPGAVHLRSDLERKAYFGVEPLEKLPAEAYQPAVSGEIYDIMQAKARQALSAGHSVILDAVHGTQAERDAASNIATEIDCAFHGVWLDADTSVRVERVECRHHDASDADSTIVRKQAKLEVGDMDWHCIDAGQALPELVVQMSVHLGVS